MLSARASNAQHASDAARRAEMRKRFECAVTVFSFGWSIFPRMVSAAKTKRRPRDIARPAQTSITPNERNDGQLTLSAAAARRPLIGRAPTLVATWTRL